MTTIDISKGFPQGSLDEVALLELPDGTIIENAENQWQKYSGIYFRSMDNHCVDCEIIVRVIANDYELNKNDLRSMTTMVRVKDLSEYFGEFEVVLVPYISNKKS